MTAVDTMGDDDCVCGRWCDDVMMIAYVIVKDDVMTVVIVIENMHKDMNVCYSIGSVLHNVLKCDFLQKG